VEDWCGPSPKFCNPAFLRRCGTHARSGNWWKNRAERSSPAHVGESENIQSLSKIRNKNIADDRLNTGRRC